MVIAIPQRRSPIEFCRIVDGIGNGIESPCLSCPSRFINDPIKLNLIRQSHVGKQANDNAAVFRFVFLNQSPADKLIKNLPDRHRMIGRKNRIDGVLDRVDFGPGPAITFY
jgi:hypothetical protein